MVACAPPQPIRASTVRYLERAYRDADPQAFDEGFQPDYVEHGPERTSHGRRVACESLTDYHDAFSGLRLSVVDRLVEADTVILRLEGDGTPAGLLHDLDQAGRPAKVRGTVVIRIAENKAVEGWSVWEPSPLLGRLYVGRLPAEQSR